MSETQKTNSKERYINPFTDYGFKRLFGEEPHKNLLIDFLNEVLKEEAGIIKDITYLKNEHLGVTEGTRKSVFDIYCENEKGEKFIVELQKAEQKFFKDRVLYYTTAPVREQEKTGKWNFRLKSVYTIAILDFVFDEGKDDVEKYRYDVKLMDKETCKVFYDKLTFIYFEMPKFDKPVEELENRYEKWLYVIRNLNKLDRVPHPLREKIFEQLFEVAEIAKFTPEQLRSYESSLKEYRDFHNIVETAEEKGEQRGLEKGRKERDVEVIKNSLNMGLDIATISKIAGLSEQEVERIKKENDL